jgi:hypothetical protein
MVVLAVAVVRNSGDRGDEGQSGELHRGRHDAGMRSKGIDAGGSFVCGNAKCSFERRVVGIEADQGYCRC